MTLTIETNHESETIELAESLGRLAKRKDLYLLEGELGAGKTTFTKGLAKGLDIDHMIKSPTYTLIREYTKGRMPLYHMDVYRLEEGGGEEMGLEEYFYGDGLTVVEWATFIKEELPNEFLKIILKSHYDSIEKRTITFEPQGIRYEKLVEELEKLRAEKKGRNNLEKRKN